MYDSPYRVPESKKMPRTDISPWQLFILLTILILTNLCFLGVDVAIGMQAATEELMHKAGKALIVAVIFMVFALFNLIITFSVAYGALLIPRFRKRGIGKRMGAGQIVFQFIHLFGLLFLL